MMKTWSDFLWNPFNERDPGGRRQERGEGKEGEVGLLWIRWPSQKVPLKMVVQAREGFGLASMGTLVSPAYCCLCNVSPSSPPSLSPRSPSSQTEFFKSIHHHCSSSNMMTCIIFKIIISAPLISSIARSYLPSPWSAPQYRLPSSLLAVHHLPRHCHPSMDASCWATTCVIISSSSVSP